MRELRATGATLPDAYHEALETLCRFGEVTPCPAWNTECKEIGMTMCVDNPLAEPRISRLFPGGPADLQQYVMEICDGILDFEIERGNWEYTYHKRLQGSIPPVIWELKKDPNSRRACIGIRYPKDSSMNDPPCLQHIQFFIRNGKLDMDVLFRSNDAFKATFMNAYALIELQKRVSEALGVPVGTYTHRANSFHVYEKDWDALKKAVDRISECDNLTYMYDGDWDEQMEESIPDILSKVEALKNKE